MGICGVFEDYVVGEFCCFVVSGERPPDCFTVFAMMWHSCIECCLIVLWVACYTVILNFEWVCNMFVLVCCRTKNGQDTDKVRRNWCFLFFLG